AGPFDAAAGSRDAFVLKMGAGGSGLAYAAFWGGSGDEAGRAIAVDGQGSAYVTGTSRSPDLPITAGSPGGAYHGGDDVFLFKLDAAGTGLAYGTYLGGSGDDRGQDLAVDLAGSAYLAGDTTSSDLPLTAGAPDAELGGQDAFVAKLDAAGAALIYLTYLGGRPSHCRRCRRPGQRHRSDPLGRLAGYRRGPRYPPRWS
ncbi:MAG: SBBP repeat-containing protein, partial [Anaerolineae bacterium]